MKTKETLTAIADELLIKLEQARSIDAIKNVLMEFENTLEEYKNHLNTGFFEELYHLKTDIETAEKSKSPYIDSIKLGLKSDIEALKTESAF